MRGKTLLPIICILAAVFTSCSDSGNSKEQPSEPEQITTAVLEEPDYPVLKADENSITFNDYDDLYTAHCMNTDNFNDDESECRLSVDEYKGERQLKIEVLDKGEDGYKVPKIVFDVDELVGTENLSKVKSFSIDITQTAVGEVIGDDGEPMFVAGNLMGGFGSIVGEKCDEWYEPTGSANNFATGEWNFEWVYYHAEGKWLLKGFADGTTDSTLVFMRWNIPNQADIYLDNLTFYDADGKSIPIVYQPGSVQMDDTEENTVQNTSESD